MNTIKQRLASLGRHYPPQFEAWRGSGRQAGVLVALTDEAEPRVVLGRRAEHLPLHPGEIAFPGGKREDEDHGPWDTALRESEEEAALPPATVTPLAEMPALVTRTGFSVHPCVGMIPAHSALRADPEEFDLLLMPPLALFAEAGRFELQWMRLRDERRAVPHYSLQEGMVWGVTATVLAQVVNVVYDAGLDLKRDWKE